MQQWILSGMLGILGLSLSVSLAYSATLMIDRGKTDNAYGLWIMGIIVGMLVVGGVRLILQRSALTPWLLAGALPCAIAGFFIF